MVLALAGMAAANGYLSLPVVMAIGALAGFAGDQTLFFIGRRYGKRIFARFPWIGEKIPRVQHLLRRWDVVAIILVRFLYGMRIAGPIVIGSSGIAPWRLAVFNLIGALIWAPLVAGLGYLAGQAVEAWIGHLHHAQILLLMAVVLVIVAARIVVVWRRRRQ